MPNGNTVKHGWILLCMCTPLYNETLRGCFTVGEKKKIEKVEISIVYTDGRMARCCDKMEIIINPELFIETMWLSATFTVLP